MSRDSSGQIQSSNLLQVGRVLGPETFVCVADAAVIEELQRLRVSINDFNVKGVIGHGHFGEIQVAGERGTKNVFALKIQNKADVLSQQNVCRVIEISSSLSAVNLLFHSVNLNFEVHVSHVSYLILHNLCYCLFLAVLCAVLFSALLAK